MSPKGLVRGSVSRGTATNCNPVGSPSQACFLTWERGSMVLLLPWDRPRARRRKELEACPAAKTAATNRTAALGPVLRRPRVCCRGGRCSQPARVRREPRLPTRRICHTIIWDLLSLLVAQPQELGVWGCSHNTNHCQEPQCSDYGYQTGSWWFRHSRVSPEQS